MPTRVAQRATATAFRCNPRETEYALRVVTRTKVAVVGASGYAGEELVRLLLAHPEVDLVAATSRSVAGKSLAQVLPRFAHLKTATTLKFSDPDPKQIARDAGLVFLALPHGLASEFAKPLLSAGARVVDLSADFRVKDANVNQVFYVLNHPPPVWLARSVSGFPEFTLAQFPAAHLSPGPGGYPTTI